MRCIVKTHRRFFSGGRVKGRRRDKLQKKNERANGVSGGARAAAAIAARSAPLAAIIIAAGPITLAAGQRQLAAIAAVLGSFRRFWQPSCGEALLPSAGLKPGHLAGCF